MLRYFITVYFTFFVSYFSFSQLVPQIEVPERMEFAGMRLSITKGARKIIQEKVDMLVKSPKYFMMKVDRANLYFPIIDRVFAEEDFPQDFKYLALQESSLISDAVSSSNAVGYWQFKKESAIEVGLRVDSKVDERMNIVASTRGAAKYLKRNNGKLGNWIYALMSYNTGLTGAQKYIDDKFLNTNTMTIDNDTHWYVITFLAHKLVFEQAVGKSGNISELLVEYIDGSHKSLNQIAHENDVDKEVVKKYNKWLKIDKVPADKIYSVMLIVPISKANVYAHTHKTTEVVTIPKKVKHASVSDVKISPNIAYIVFINGIKAILAGNGDTPAKLALKAKITKAELVDYNEMHSFDDVKAGTFYYLGNKKNKAMVMFHTVQYGESIWDIAQKYGMNIHAIRKRNRMDDHEVPAPGRVLWLRKKRPANSPVEYKKVEKPEEINTTNVKTITVEFDGANTNEVVDDPVADKSVVEIDGNKHVVHTVAAGETVFGICKKYQITSDHLLEWNNLKSYNVSIGQQLIVGIKGELEDTKIEPTKSVNSINTHVVQAGETAWRISKMYNITIDQLKEWNNKSDLNLNPGEVLIIKKD